MSVYKFICILMLISEHRTSLVRRFPLLYITFSIDQNQAIWFWNEISSQKISLIELCEGGGKQWMRVTKMTWLDYSQLLFRQNSACEKFFIAFM